MLNFRYSNNRLLEVTADYARTKDESAGRWCNRNDFTSIGPAEVVAQDATALTGDVYLATDTPNTSPRFDVIRAPKVGDEVSYAFNGDYYPDGKIVRVSKSMRVVKTDTGHTYYRRGKTAAWVQTGGTWVLVQGHVSRRNPSF